MPGCTKYLPWCSGSPWQGFLWSSRTRPCAWCWLYSWPLLCLPSQICSGLPNPQVIYQPHSTCWAPQYYPHMSTGIVQPYLNRRDNILALLYYVAICLVVTFTMILHADQLSDENDKMFSVCVVIIFAVVGLIAVDHLYESPLTPLEECLKLREPIQVEMFERVWASRQHKVPCILWNKVTLYGCVLNFWIKWCVETDCSSKKSMPFDISTLCFSKLRSLETSFYIAGFSWVFS